jgi:DNA polymerase I-like protein with 3'-5' exonuclease and polymerase domains
MMVEKRLSALIHGKGSWFNKVTTKGRIHGTVNAQGTVTYRGAHSNPNLGQIPKVGKPYGAECRELFSHGMGDDWTFMGCDMSGIEFRLLAHYLYQFDGGALVDTVLNGDIHSVNQEAAGLPSRDMAKTFIYAFIYGGGDGKLGSIVGKGRAEGTRLRDKFLKGLPALATLISRVQTYRKRNKNFVKCLDGRLIPVEGAHTTLNYLLQTAGAILSKAWMREFHKLCEDRGFVWGVDYMQLLWVHDELQCAVRTTRASELGDLCVKAIENVGEHYKLNCPITGEYKVGTNWKETH